MFSTEKPYKSASRIAKTPKKISARECVESTALKKRLKFDDDDDGDDDCWNYDRNDSMKRSKYKTPERREVTVYHSPGSLWSIKNRKDKFLQIEVSIGEALAKSDREMFYMLRSCLVELLEVQPETNEERVKQSKLIKFVRTKLSGKG